MWSFFLGFSLFLTQTIFCSEFENAIPHEREGSFAPVIPPVTRSTTQKPSTTVHPDNHEYNNHNRSSSSEKVLFCYYGSWAVYRPGFGKFSVENIDPFLCTHVVYAFAGLGYDNRIRVLDPWNDLKDNYGRGACERFTNLKRINPKLKTLIAVGGWNEGSIKYSHMVSNEQSRKTFVESCLVFLKNFNFDGLDFDWEYPGARGGKPEDKQNYILLLKELKEAFKPKGYLLTAAVSAGKWYIDPAYNIASLSKYLDYINVMCYDYHGGWENKTGHNAPLYNRPEEQSTDRISNVNFSINYWLANGAPKEKIVMGMGTYGRSFTLSKSENNGLGAFAPQRGRAGPYTREPGSLGYNEICEFQKKQKWTIIRDPHHLAPYAYKNRQWVGYDDIESITLKARLIKSFGLAGGMVWSLETDDFHGLCHGHKFPLLTAIKNEFTRSDIQIPIPKPTASTSMPKTTKKSTVSTSTSSSTSFSKPFSTTTTTPSTTSTKNGICNLSNQKTTTTFSTSTTSSSTISSLNTSSSTTIDSPNDKIICKESGTFRHPKDCRKFYRCVDTGLEKQFLLFEYTCPVGTVFNTNSRICLWPLSVPDCKNYYTFV